VRDGSTLHGHPNITATSSDIPGTRREPSFDCGYKLACLGVDPLHRGIALGEHLDRPLTGGQGAGGLVKLNDRGDGVGLGIDPIKFVPRISGHSDGTKIENHTGTGRRQGNFRFHKPTARIESCQGILEFLPTHDPNCTLADSNASLG
jgi:hypothetical protein